MEEITTTENNWRVDSASEEPHFNDERTLREAQPVVPLDNVAKEGRRRWLMLGGAFVIACLLGATAAMALIRLRQPSIEADKTETTAPEPEEQAVQTNESVIPTTDMSQVATSDVAEVQPSKIKRKNSHKPAAAPPQVRIMIRTGPVSSSGGQARLIDTWEEKRQRRVSRERDPQQNHHSRDLFRIREIFEGPRRPRRANNY